uniref:Uncharacterized protein n=1 Tax=Timema genevievae TaxID=629358 RepID=A0A7R9K8K1_TIMGE|nr:unnamed protein product [Timema genevievae]
MTKNNPYRGAINNLIMKLKKGGILSKLHVSDPISDEGENKVTNVSLSNTLPLFFLLAAGLTTAFVLLVLERVSTLSLRELNARRRSPCDAPVVVSASQRSSSGQRWREGAGGEGPLIYNCRGKRMA